MSNKWGKGSKRKRERSIKREGERLKKSDISGSNSKGMRNKGKERRKM